VGKLFRDTPLCPSTESPGDGAEDVEKRVLEGAIEVEGEGLAGAVVEDGDHVAGAEGVAGQRGDLEKEREGVGAGTGFQSNPTKTTNIWSKLTG